MRSLFTKILLWFLLTVVVSLTGSFYIWNTFGQRPNQQPQVSSRQFELREARRAWCRGLWRSMWPFRRG